MKVIAPADYSLVTPLGRGVAAGEVVDVDIDVGNTLLAQGWQPTGREKPAKSEKHESTQPDRPDPAARLTEET